MRRPSTKLVQRKKETHIHACTLTRTHIHMRVHTLSHTNTHTHTLSKSGKMHFWQAKLNTNKYNKQWFNKNKLVYWYSLTEQKAYHADNLSTDKHSTMLVQRTTHTTPTHIPTSPPIVLVYQKQTNTSMQNISSVNFVHLQPAYVGQKHFMQAISQAQTIQY